jgi:hypothetical protein
VEFKSTDNNGCSKEDSNYCSLIEKGMNIKQVQLQDKEKIVLQFQKSGLKAKEFIRHFNSLSKCAGSIVLTSSFHEWIKKYSSGEL